MTFDTEWPAATPNRGGECKKITADRLEWCIRYLAEEARRGGFPEAAEALESIAPTKTADQPRGHGPDGP
jgi:hypothetical protein